MSDYLDKLNFPRGEVKDDFRLAIKKEEYFQFFVGS
jgi:hypothetical protein